LTTSRRALRAVVVDAKGRAVRAPGLASWLARIAPPRARGIVTIALVSDAHIRTLNRTYRRKDASTDVLSFPVSQPSFAPRMRHAVSQRAASMLQARPKVFGDIVIARGAARRQARMAGHSELTELRILALHGLLHLLGYDHHSDTGAMARLEARLRRKGGLREGLIERAQRS